MTTDQSLFGNTNTGNQPQGDAAVPNASSQNPFATTLAAIKNEHGAQKFQSAEDLAKGYVSSQEFIANILREKQELAARLQEATAAQEQFKSQVSGQEELKRIVEQLTQKVDSQGNTKPQELDPAKIAELVKSTLSAEQQAGVAKQNQTAVVSALTAKFGEKAEEQYNRAAEEMGLSVAEMNALAAKSPKAVLKALGLEPAVHKQHTAAPFGSVLNTAALAPAENSFVGRNKTQLEIGATTQELNQEAANARKMVEELHAAGLTIDDLTKPSVFNKYFGN